MRTGIACLEDLLKTVRRQDLKGGYVVVLHYVRSSMVVITLICI